MSALVGFNAKTDTKGKLPSLRREFISRLDYMGEFVRINRNHVRRLQTD
jgi:hypothetical protein